MLHGWINIVSSWAPNSRPSTASETPLPMAIPATPPKRLSVSASVTNCFTMSPAVAPTLFAPATSCVSMATRAATATMPGIASAAIAVASPSTSVDWARPAKPSVCDVVAAALDSMKIRSVPTPRMRSVTPCWVPYATATSASTELTPMTTPSEVSALRSRLAKIARRGMRNVSRRLEVQPSLPVPDPPAGCPFRCPR